MIQNEEMLLPEISAQTFCDHIADDDFPLKYGNPVVVVTPNKKYICMTWERHRLNQDSEAKKRNAGARDEDEKMGVTDGRDDR